MKFRNLHRWDVPPKEAIRIQKKLQSRVTLKKLRLKDIHLIAGVDVSVKENYSKSAIVVLTYPKLEKVETVSFVTKNCFPYIPGLLSFREGPCILECIKRLKSNPNLFIFDGQGIAHPRKIGLASHVGLVLNKPSIGSAKSHLFGSYTMPGKNKGDFSIVKDNNAKPIGACLRTRKNTKPIFVSPGHLIDIPSTIKIILACSPQYRIPEPIRLAHHAASFFPKDVLA